ncbi:MAG: hypothetical protein JXR77_07020 [Lentisphaeria bacterium]|nr:hypothetical protein [Lentisphaeria bacterium]
MRKLLSVGLSLSICCAVGLLRAAVEDRDGDGIPDAVEASLGSRADEPDRFTTVLEDGAEAGTAAETPFYDPGLDVLRVAVCHAGDDRFVWRVDFVGEPHPGDTVLHLYLDADRNPGTGRQDPGPVAGVEYMLSVIRGSGASTVFAADGSRQASIPVTVAVLGRSVYLSADVNLDREGDAAAFELYVLCHAAEAAAPSGRRMTDSSRRVAVAGVPLDPRPKVRRLVDHDVAEGTDRTCGLDIIRALLAREDTVQVPYDRLETDGFEVDVQTSRRFGHVSRTRPGGRVSVAAPPGSYHVGFLMYDDASDERIVFRVGGSIRGVACADCNNNRHWIFWLREPILFAGGEAVELIGTGPTGQHGIGAVLFLPQPPPIAGFPYEVRHLTTFTPVGEDGRVLVSWTTGMPSITRFEFGTDTAYGSVAGAEHSTLVHRVSIEGLAPGATYHGRAVGRRPDGSDYASEDLAFTARSVPPPPTVAEVRRVPLRVRNPHAFPALSWPVTGGIPIPEGQLADAAAMRLTADGREVPAQIRTTARWLDGSVKWVLITLLADVAPESERVFTLEYGRGVGRTAAGTDLLRQDGDGVLLLPGPCAFRILADGTLELPGEGPCATVATGSGGQPCTSPAAAEIRIEERGPLRATVAVRSRLGLPDGQGGIGIEQRISVFRGLPLVHLAHTFVVEAEAAFAEVESLSLRLPLGASSWRLGRVAGGSVELPAGSAAIQHFDHAFTVSGEESEGRLTGSALGGDALVAVRDFWQQYPKGFRAGNGVFEVDLCPDFEAGRYDAFPFEKEGHQLYYYLRQGRYRFRRGMAKTHDLLIGVACGPQAPAYATLFQRPLLLVAPPQWLCDSLAFYAVAPRDTTRFRAYEESIDRNLSRYIETRERQHDYGLMNFGDWYGERGANWGNIEYDTQHALLLEFIRSGNEEAFFLADQAERHNRDIDTVQWAPDPGAVGMVYIHQMGHVGGYYTESVPGTLGIPQAGATISHAWAEGHFNHYFLTGDRRSYETGRAVVDYFARKEMARPYDFTSCRVPGWHLIANAIAYASTCDPYYLNVSRVIVDRVLETQDRAPRPLPEYQCEPGRTHQVGGWSRMMVPGHCHCIPRHRGNAGFMVAVLLSGLKYYHDVTGDPAVRECIVAGARSLVDECYSPEVHGFRYTSCPAMRYTPGSSPLMAEGIARAYLWTRDPGLEDVLTMALPLGAGGSGYGKGFSMYYRAAPRLLADLAACGLTLNEQATAPRVPFTPPAWMQGPRSAGQIVVQAEAFTAQGGGTCQVRDDRQAAWGSIVTYWHQDIGHWLEWTVEAPETGEYVLRLRYASGSPEPRRELRLDGKVPFAGAEDIRFDTTGGYGTRADEWRWRTLEDPPGREARLRLERGSHVLRLTNLGDGLALDFLALAPCPAPPL